MSGVAAQALHHVVRRGLEQIPTTTDGSLDIGTMTGDPQMRFEVPVWSLVVSGVILIVASLLVISVSLRGEAA